MKLNPLVAALLLSLAGAGSVLASLTVSRSVASNSPIPNLVGTWKVETEGVTILHDEQYHEKSHHASQFTKLTAEAVIQKQEGRRVVGIIKSPRYTEDFVGFISTDGKDFSYVDEDGILDGKIVSDNLIEVVYRHVSPTESVVASGTYKRM